VSIGIIAASLGLMKDADPSELFPAASNTGKRNYLNIANFIAAVMAGLSFGYLSGLFGSVQAHSHAFSLAAILLVVGIGFQTYFAVVTTRRV